MDRIGKVEREPQILARSNGVVVVVKHAADKARIGDARKTKTLHRGDFLSVGRGVEAVRLRKPSPVILVIRSNFHEGLGEEVVGALVTRKKSPLLVDEAHGKLLSAERRILRAAVDGHLSRR